MANKTFDLGTLRFRCSVCTHAFKANVTIEGKWVPEINSYGGDLDSAGTKCPVCGSTSVDFGGGGELPCDLALGV